MNRLAYVALALLLLAGCKERKAPPTSEEGPTRQDIRAGIGKMLPAVQRVDAGVDLMNIAQLYAASILEGKSPRSAADLPELPRPLVKQIDEGTYVVIWGAPTNTPLSVVIAYEKDVPTKGGMVAVLQGSVNRMTPEEFKAATKAVGR